MEMAAGNRNITLSAMHGLKNAADRKKPASGAGGDQRERVSGSE
jgi:hypothetical protein